MCEKLWKHVNGERLKKLSVTPTGKRNWDSAFNLWCYFRSASTPSDETSSRTFRKQQNIQQERVTDKRSVICVPWSGVETVTQFSVYGSSSRSSQFFAIPIFVLNSGNSHELLKIRVQPAIADVILPLRSIKDDYHRLVDGTWSWMLKELSCKYYSKNNPLTDYCA